MLHVLFCNLHLNAGVMDVWRILIQPEQRANSNLAVQIQVQKNFTLS